MNGPLIVCCESHLKAEPYLEALIATTVDPEQIRVLVPGDDAQDAGALAARASGLLLCGGPDVEPWRYGEARLPDVPLYPNPDLDTLELALIEGAWSVRSPVWAICRGMQSINVFFGGSLYQDLPSQIQNLVEHDLPEPPDDLAHRIDVTDDEGALGALLGREETLVNTRHHQAVKILGQGLSAVGESPDGVLEAMEWRGDDWWMWAVQWHPENLIELPVQRELWRRFAHATRSRPAGPAN